MMNKYMLILVVCCAGRCASVDEFFITDVTGSIYGLIQLVKQHGDESGVREAFLKSERQGLYINDKETGQDVVKEAFLSKIKRIEAELSQQQRKTLDEQDDDVKGSVDNLQKLLKCEQKKIVELSWYRYAKVALLREHMYDSVQDLQSLARKIEGMNLKEFKNFSMM